MPRVPPLHAAETRLLASPGAQPEPAGAQDATFAAVLAESDIPVPREERSTQSLERRATGSMKSPEAAPSVGESPGHAGAANPRRQSRAGAAAEMPAPSSALQGAVSCVANLLVSPVVDGARTARAVGGAPASFVASSATRGAHAQGDHARVWESVPRAAALTTPLALPANELVVHRARPAATGGSPPGAPNAEAPLDGAHGAQPDHVDAAEPLPTGSPLLSPTVARNDLAQATETAQVPAATDPARVRPTHAEASTPPLPVRSPEGLAAHGTASAPNTAGSAPGSLPVQTPPTVALETRSFTFAAEALGPTVAPGELWGVVESLRASHQGGRQVVVVSLAPPELGHVRIVVAEALGGVLVRLQVERPEAHALLSAVFEGMVESGLGDGGGSHAEEPRRQQLPKSNGTSHQPSFPPRVRSRRGVALDTWI